MEEDEAVCVILQFMCFSWTHRKQLAGQNQHKYKYYLNTACMIITHNGFIQ